MLVHALNVEANDTQSECWEERLTASGACNASGVVDVKHFVAICLQQSVERAETVQGVMSRSQQEEKRLAVFAARGPSNPSRRDSREKISEC
eukprot:1679650-Amphidinium_carterae.1